MTAVLVVIFTVHDDRLHVLLVRRSAEPFRDRWSLPGGRLLESESLDGAAVRKLEEETGVADVFLEQLYTFSDLDGQGSIAVAYFALVDYRKALLAQRSEWLPAWFPVQDVILRHEGPGGAGEHAAFPDTHPPPSTLQPPTSDTQPTTHHPSPLLPLAFRNEEVIDYALRRLRAKLEYSNVAYSLLPDEFTLSELQGTYEAILARPLDKRNFRKRVASLGLVEPTGRRSGAGRHRPAQLYRFRERHPITF